ncbi:MAG: hypothetical protein OHK0024_33560 [Thalassobaculales bacterium]
MTKQMPSFRIVPVPPPGEAPAADAMPPPEATAAPADPREIGGPTGPEPTRYGDWERNGRCTDF